ncbi:MAG: fumarylacetoacetate hydrolase family protein [Emcibacteraceae bacterium]
MKLASLKSGRDGALVVVSKDLKRYTPATAVASTMQAALDEWEQSAPKLQKIYEDLENGSIEGEPFDPAKCDAPLPRSYHWADGSAYVTHVELVRKTRGAELPESFWTDPLMYMGASDAFLGPNDDLPFEVEEWGIDFEAEIAVITDDVPAGTSVKGAAKHIKLISFLNDVTLRNLVPKEIVKQFGFYQTKPWTSFPPVFVTPDELGAAWDGGKLSLPIVSTLNGKEIGAPEAGIDMTFDFCTLVSHAAKSRSLMAGTVIGSGTVANEGSPLGSSCLAEVRALEILKKGKAITPFMQFGDRIEIEIFDRAGKSIFGKIDQKVVKYTPPADE